MRGGLDGVVLHLILPLPAVGEDRGESRQRCDPLVPLPSREGKNNVGVVPNTPTNLRRDEQCAGLSRSQSGRGVIAIDLEELPGFLDLGIGFACIHLGVFCRGNFSLDLLY